MAGIVRSDTPTFKPVVTGSGTLKTVVYCEVRPPGLYFRSMYPDMLALSKQHVNPVSFEANLQCDEQIWEIRNEK